MNNDSEFFKVVNVYSGVIAGRSMFNAQAMALKYVEKYLGKDIKIIHLDHERIAELEKQLDLAERFIDDNHLSEQYERWKDEQR